MKKFDWFLLNVVANPFWLAVLFFVVASGLDVVLLQYIIPVDDKGLLLKVALGVNLFAAAGVFYLVREIQKVKFK